MCKSSTYDLSLQRDGPCYFSARSYGDACSAFSLGWSWRASLANVLRRWADKAEGVRSFVIVANAPPQIVFDDVVEACTAGFNGATKYLNDVWRERVHGSTDLTIGPVLPSGTVRENDGE